MNTIHLQDYVRHGMICNNIQQADLADAALFEAKPDAELLKSITLPVYSLDELKTGTGLGGVVHGLLAKHTRLVVVLDALGVQDVAGLMSSLAEHGLGNTKKLLIINTSSGISGIKAKGWNEQYDCGIARSFGVSCVDPADVISFFASLRDDGLRYIRLQNGQYPSALYEGYEGTLTDVGVVSLKSQGLSGAYGTVVGFGRCTSELLNALITLQESDRLYDCFIGQRFDWSISDELRDSLLQTEKLVLVGDVDSEYIKNYAQSLLFAAGLVEVEVEVISPQTAGLTGFHDEYMYEQAGFGVSAFVEKLGVQ